MTEIIPDKNKDFKIYTNYSVCRKCKGACCTSYSGLYAPEDFGGKISVDYIAALLLTRRFVVDFNDTIYATEESPEHIGKNYFIRPRHIDEVDNELNIKGVCINWEYETGCSLKEAERPFQCRMLIPSFKGKVCKPQKSDNATSIDIAGRWSSYQNIIKNAINKYVYCKNLMRVNEAEVNDNINSAIKNIIETIKTISSENDF